VLGQGVPDLGLGQDVGERQDRMAREPVADVFQARHRIGCGSEGDAEPKDKPPPPPGAKPYCSPGQAAQNA
jgi:hypothetical protein